MTVTTSALPPDGTGNTWEWDADDLIDAIARSIADATEAYEKYHTWPPDAVRFEAEYFLKRLRRRGYDVVEKPT